MKLSELKEAVDRAMEKQRIYRDGEDPDVVIRTDNPSVGGNASVAVKLAAIGSDWNAGRFWIFPFNGVVKYRTHNKASLVDAAKERLQELKDGYEKCGQKYIAKSREQEWIDGFAEGFKRFGIEITTHGDKMKLYYAEVCVDYESSDFVGIYTTYQKCYDALVAFGRYGDDTYIYEVEADSSTPLRCWSMTNCRPYVDPLVPNFVPARNYQTKDFVYGKAEDYQGQLDTPKQSV